MHACAATARRCSRRHARRNSWDCETLKAWEEHRVNVADDRATLIPRDIAPAAALRAYSICTSFPEGENVVNEKLYSDSPIFTDLAGPR